MSIWQMIFSDPVVWGSFLGLSIVLGIGAYYIWYFMTQVANSVEQ